MEYEINKETLNELLEYIPETGALIWKERGIEWFKSEGSWKRFNKRYAGKEAFTQIHNIAQNQEQNTQNDYFTMQGFILNKTYRKSRIIYIMHYRDIEKDKWVSFKDKNPLNCRIENLELTTRIVRFKSKNNQLNSTSGFKGVCFCKKYNKWKAQIKVNGKKINLGYFSAKEEAIESRKAANTKYGFTD